MTGAARWIGGVLQKDRDKAEADIPSHGCQTSSGQSSKTLFTPASLRQLVPQDRGLPWSPSVLEGMLPDGMTSGLVPCVVLTLECLDLTRVFANCIDCYNNTASKLGIGDASADCFLVWVDNDLHFVRKELTV